MKKRFCIVLAGLLLLSLLSGCGEEDAALTPDEEVQKTDLIKSMQQDGSIKPGAKVDTSKDSDGNIVVTFENEDGSGGGGMFID